MLSQSARRQSIGVLSTFSFSSRALAAANLKTIVFLALRVVMKRIKRLIRP
jgi:hypothetical protein